MTAGSTAPLWLAYAFGFGLASALVDAAIKKHFLAGLLLTGGILALAYAAFQAFARGLPDGLWTGLTVFGFVAAGYGIGSALFAIGRWLSGAALARKRKSEEAA
jgi:hypothetical protein